MNKLFRLANNPTVRGVAIWAAPLIVTWIMNKLALKGDSNSAKKSLKK